MNTSCYKVIFSKRLGTLVAVGEHTTACGKAASGQAHRGVAHGMSFVFGNTDGFVGILRLSFASIALTVTSSPMVQRVLPHLRSNPIQPRAQQRLQAIQAIHPWAFMRCKR